MLKKSLVLLSLCAVMSLEAGLFSFSEEKVVGPINNDTLKGKMEIGYAKFSDRQKEVFGMACVKAGLVDCKDVATFWTKFKQLDKSVKKEIREMLAAKDVFDVTAKPARPAKSAKAEK